ncbi:MAPEG family protein [Stakelama marina]|uniref:MAPEG family protein n=1 Tax=Stakelama marina TaxID=2826939 RepID=A0A8T4IEG6_9SPHN|nr:MAPEG family protein [Stakelama marina]MBR0552950.1 MAPEG family protein [Stakelama marina]
MLTITLVTAGACALIAVWLGFRVGQIRRAEGISVGDGGNMRLIARMRAQMNFVEYAPFVLILIALIEHAQGSSVLLWVAAAAFVIARILHAFGMDGWMPGRVTGIAVTLLLLAILGLYAVILPFESGITHAQPAAPVQAVSPTA